MLRTNRNNAICFKNLEQEMARCPETYGHIDLLCAGWPCQNNSIAGNREGHAGAKSGLFKEFCRLLRVFNPRWFIGENVPGLLSVNAGKDFCETLSELQDCGYGVSWRILDSQYFGVAQQRRRIFFVGRFGEPCPPEILFEQEGSSRDIAPNNEIREVGLCISTRDGERQDPSCENIIASTIMANDYKQVQHGQFGNQGNIVAKCLLTEENKLRKISSDGGNIVAHTLGTSQRGTPGRVWEDTCIATTDTERKGEVTGISDKLDLPRGVVIGNAVTVNVAEWIGKRIMEYELHQRQAHP